MYRKGKLHVYKLADNNTKKIKDTLYSKSIITQELIDILNKKIRYFTKNYDDAQDYVQEGLLHIMNMPEGQTMNYYINGAIGKMRNELQKRSRYYHKHIQVENMEESPFNVNNRGEKVLKNGKIAAHRNGTEWGEHE